MTLKTLILLLLAVGLVVPLAAQEVELTETYFFESGTAFDLPESIPVNADEDYPEIVYFDIDEDHLLTAANFGLFKDEGFAADDDLNDAIAWFFEFYFGTELEFNVGDVEVTTIDDREAATLVYADDLGNRAFMVAIRFDDGTFGIIDAFADEKDFEGDDVVLEIAATFNLDDAEDDAGEDVSTATEDAAAACVVSTGQSNTVQLRVGPGTNRTVYAFLPANRDFTPLGRAEAGDGSAWFQMDKDEVAPTAAASEAWVAVEDVDTEGDCDKLGESSAPPIVPIIPAAPAASDDSGGSASDSGSSGGSTGVLPAAGTWTVSFASTGKASCLNTGTIDFPSNLSPELASISVIGGGTAVNFDGDRLNQVSPGVYSGLVNLDQGMSAQITLYTVSSTQFSGEIRVNVPVEGTTCSATIGISATRN